LARHDRQLLGDLASIDFQKSKPSMGGHWVRRKIQYSSNRCSDSDSGKECDPKPVRLILPRHLNVLSCKGTAGFGIENPAVERV
jgi:hypothetical protein